MLTERVKEIYHEIEQFEVATKEQLEQYRQRFVGRKGAVEALFEGLKDIVKEERRAVGQELNALKNYANDRFLAIQADFEANDNGSGGAPVVVGVAGSVVRRAIGFCFCNDPSRAPSVKFRHQYFPKQIAGYLNHVGTQVEGREETKHF